MCDISNFGMYTQTQINKWEAWIIHVKPLQWRHNGHDGVSNHQPRHCLCSRIFRRKSKKNQSSALLSLCAWNSPAIGEFPAQMASNAENVYIWWRHRAQSMSWLAIHGLPVGHGPPLSYYWLRRIRMSLPSTKRSFNYMSSFSEKSDLRCMYVFIQLAHV